MDYLLMAKLVAIRSLGNPPTTFVKQEIVF